MWFLRTFGLCGLLFTSATNAANAQSPTPGFTSCAWVRAENDGAGAGFVLDVDKKLLITCRHLVADRAKVDVIFPWVRDGELVTDRRVYLGNRLRLRELGLLVTGKVLKTSDELDLALIELESIPAGVRSVTLADRSPQCGERLHVVGNRLDLETVWNVTVGPLRTHGQLVDGYFWRGKKLAVNADVLIGQLPTEEGDSGGPVFNAEGKLVGMASALRRQCPIAAIAISAAEIRKFASVMAVPPKDKLRPVEAVETLICSTVWIRPAATDVHVAGILIENDLVLTRGKGLIPGDRVGMGFPIREHERWVGERTAYRDPLGLQLRGRWRSGVVLASDGDRDLALIRLDSPVEFMRPVAFATRMPTPGEVVHAMSHPGGLEFAWVYAGGTVRQRGSIAIVPGENAKRVVTILCQLPAQAGSPGGPVLNDKGELIGLLAAKESTQQVAYVVATEEIASFLDVALSDRPARTLAGLLDRIQSLPHRFAIGAAEGLARRGEEHRLAGRLVQAKQDCASAISLDPGCVLARVCRARMFELAEALAELDAAVERGPFDRKVLVFRAELAANAKDWRKARGDLERILDADPADADARRQLVGVLLELNEDAKAATAVGDTLRADAKQLPVMAKALLAQAETLAKKYPDAPSVPVGWLLKALMAAEKGTRNPTTKGQLATLLKSIAGAKDDEERLAIMRAGVKKMAGK